MARTCSPSQWEMPWDLGGSGGSLLYWACVMPVFSARPGQNGKHRAVSGRCQVVLSLLAPAGLSQASLPSPLPLPGEALPSISAPGLPGDGGRRSHRCFPVLNASHLFPCSLARHRAGSIDNNVNLGPTEQVLADWLTSSPRAELTDRRHGPPTPRPTWSRPH